MIKGKDLVNREGAGDEPLKTLDDPAATLAALRAKIEQARRTRQGEDQHCADCFRRGRDAALRIIDES